MSCKTLPDQINIIITIKYVKYDYTLIFYNKNQSWGIECT